MEPAGSDVREAEAVLERMASAADFGPAFKALASGLWAGRDAPREDQTDAGHRNIWAAELRYRALVERIPAVTFMAALDENVHELYVSPQIQTLLGYSQEEWLEDPFLWYDRLHPDDRERWHTEFARTCATGVHFKSQYRFFARDWRVVWVQGEAQIVHDESGRPLFLQGIAFDITEIKRAEEALHQTHEQLESMVEQRTSQLERANESLRSEIAERQRLEQELQARARQLAEESERKDHFLAVLAHELRNPLAPITMALEVIRHGSAPPDDLEWARGMMERQVRQMSRLIDDLLDISRINRGKVQLRREVVDLCVIVQRSMETVGPLVEEQGHQLSGELPGSPLCVVGDAVRLEQVVVNLLTNATKFTEPGGRISVDLGAAGDQVELRVADTGVGIPPDMLGNVFELFAQIDRSTSRSSQWGLGIGLALVRGLVELHGGSVEAFSEGLGRGSEFVARLPMVEGGLAGVDRIEGDPPEGLTALPKRTILVVDDHPEFARSLAMLLRSWGQVVHVAHNGDEALAAAPGGACDVVLLDLGMPGKDGFEVARELRQAGVRATIIALTGYGRAEDRERAAEAGFDHHLTKPVAPAALHAALARIPAGERPD